MNFFEIFGLPVSYRIDESELRKRYFALSRETHPDFHTLSHPLLQESSLDRNTLVTNAYTILKDVDKRLKYILQLKGVLEEEEKFQLPSGFLMEMMDINEAIDNLMSSPNAGDRAALENQVTQMEDDLLAQVEPAISGFDSGDHSDANLAAMKSYFMQKRYLWRLRQQLAGIA